MVQPASIVNTTAQRIDTLYNDTPAALVKLGIGLKDVGLTPMAAWQGVATHVDGDEPGGTDGFVAIAGVDSTGTPTVRRIAVDADGKVITSAALANGASTDWGGTITSGGDPQTLMAENLFRHYLFVQNLDDFEDLWIDFGTDADVASPSIRLLPHDAFVMESGWIFTDSVSVIAATTSHPFAAKEG